MQSKFLKIIGTIFFTLSISYCFSQVDVREDQRVGVGQANNSQVKLLVTNTEWDYSLRVQNTTESDGSKYGLILSTDNQGLGYKYGISNNVTNQAASIRDSKGLTNNVNAYGGINARGYGVHNFIRFGNGRKYGTFNQVAQTSTHANRQSYGSYNYLTPSSGDSFGTYNYVIRNADSRRAYGTYNYVRDNATTTNQKNYGIYSRVDHEGFIANYGSYVYMNSKGTVANGTTGISHGLYVLIAGAGDADRIGVYSSVNGGEGYAGKFVGDVHISGTLTNPSDKRLKDNIKPLSNAMSLIKKLSPKSYNYKKVEGHGFNPNTLRYGFIAQEINEILPNLVHDIKGDEIQSAPSKVAGVDEEDEPSNQITKRQEDYKAINYIDIIPILTQAIKEQQEEIETIKSEHQKEIDDLKTSIQLLVKEVELLKKQ